jgi:hypothetical protein
MKIRPVLARILSAHFILGLMIVTEVAFIVLAMRFVLPACRRIATYVDSGRLDFYASTRWANNFLAVLHVPVYNLTLTILCVAAAWGLFRRYVPAATRPAVRLSALASLAAMLFAVVAVLSGLMIVPTAKAADRLNARYPEPIVAERLATLDRLIGGIEQAMVNHDLATADDLSHTAMGAANDLENTGDAASTLLTSNDPARVIWLRAQLRTMASAMREAWFAARQRRADQVEAPLQRFRAAYALVKRATTRPTEWTNEPVRRPAAAE